MNFFSRNKCKLITSLVIVFISFFSNNLYGPQIAQAYTSVPGQNYQICDEQAQYLTSPWTYNALPSGSQTYTVAQYEALSGYGSTLPPLPSYIANESPTTTAAVIFAPGSDVSNPSFDYPETPLLYFFEGGAYGFLSFQSISGDQFIGGSAPGFPEPAFDNATAAGGIDLGNNTFAFSGGTSKLAATASSGASTVTTTSIIPGFINYITFSDGSTYRITGGGGTTTLTLGSNLTSSESSGSAVWANESQPVAKVTAAATQGTATVTLTSSTIPLMQYGHIRIGTYDYEVTSVSGNQSGYTVNVSSLDTDVAINTPVYYSDIGGNETVEYLDINNDQHGTTGTINTGSGWTITHNNIHDGYSKGPGNGIAIFGGDQSTIEYNCLARMGTYAAAIFGTNDVFDYNEILDTRFDADPGCGCSGGGKWWATVNADIVNNAFINDGPQGGGPIWLDNGNTGTHIAGNYFFMSYSSAIQSETGFNLDIENNLFLDNGWGAGTGGCGSNCDGAVNVNTSGGWNIPGSRYNDEILITNNQFINNWVGVNIWQSGARSCNDSGEGDPDTSYCSGGFPATQLAASGGQYYFSHIGDSSHGGTTTLTQDASSGSSTVLVKGAVAIDDQIGFSDPASTTTSDTTNVTTFNGSGTINVSSTTGFPTSGQIRVGTSNAWSDGIFSYTGAILSYTGTTGTSFTGVSFVRGSGTLGGPVLQIQPYTVNSETCYANDCKLTITPSLAANEASGATVTNAGTCQLFSTAAALPSGPLAPDGISYWDGCQWEARNVSVTSNTFSFQPSQMASTSALGGGTTVCTSSNPNNCGTNFMAYQVNGEHPYQDQTGANAIISNSSFTGCPGWDSGCSTNIFSNLNAISSPPGAQTGNGASAANNLWSNNTYVGPWSWSSVYLFGNCGGGGVIMPHDSVTSHSLSSSDCGPLRFAQWLNNWQQDTNSTSNPMLVTLNGLVSDQSFHSATATASAFEDTVNTNTISSSLALNTTTVSTIPSLSSSPHTFSVDTTSYPNGLYTLKITGTDSGNNSSNDSTPVYIDNGDFNGDGKVSLSDLAIMAAHWQQTNSNYSDGNITGQSTINNSDLSVLASNWGWSK